MADLYSDAMSDWVQPCEPVFDCGPDTELERPAATHYKIRLHFADQSSTILYVPEDEDIATAVADACDRHGWDDLTGYTIITYEKEYRERATRRRPDHRT